MSSRYSELSKGVVRNRGNLYLAQYYIIRYDIIEFIDTVLVPESDYEREEKTDEEITGVQV